MEIALQPKSTGIESTKNNSIQIESNVVENYIDLQNTTTQPWKAYLMSKEGELMKIETVQPQGRTALGVSHLPAGFYLLKLTDGKAGQSVWIIKK